MAAPFANLCGVAKSWFYNDVIKSRLEDGGIGSIVMTGKNQAIVTKDQQHAVWNSDVLIPIMQNMAANHLIKAPDMPTIQAQVHILLLLHQKKGFNAFDLPPIEDKYEVPIHLVATSIKKLICFVRNKFLKMHKPRDRVWVKHVIEMTGELLWIKRVYVCEKNLTPMFIYDILWLCVSRCYR